MGRGAAGGVGGDDDEAVSDRPAAQYPNLFSWHETEVAIRLKLQPTLSAARLAPLWRALDISSASCSPPALSTPMKPARARTPKISTR